MPTTRITVYEGTFEVGGGMGYTEKSVEYSFSIGSKTTVLGSRIVYNVTITKAATIENLFVVKVNDKDVAVERWDAWSSLSSPSRANTVPVSLYQGTNTVKLVFGRNSVSPGWTSVWDARVYLEIDYEGEAPKPIQKALPFPEQILIYAIVASIVLVGVTVAVKVIAKR